MSISVQSNAKINLALYINHKRSDGYHDISTLMQEINFRDEIIISKNKKNKINIYSKGIKTPTDKTNLCYIAAASFLEIAASQRSAGRPEAALTTFLFIFFGPQSHPFWSRKKYEQKSVK